MKEGNLRNVFIPKKIYSLNVLPGTVMFCSVPFLCGLTYLIVLTLTFSAIWYSSQNLFSKAFPEIGLHCEKYLPRIFRQVSFKHGGRSSLCYFLSTTFSSNISITFFGGCLSSILRLHGAFLNQLLYSVWFFHIPSEIMSSKSSLIRIGSLFFLAEFN